MKLSRTPQIVLVGIYFGVFSLLASAQKATVNVQNPIDLARPSETIVLKAAELKNALGVDDVRLVHVTDPNNGRELLTQAVDANDDGKFEEFLFQADIAPRETRTFTLTVGARQELKPSDFKAYGRFVRERRDDFAWENDRIAHRMYGAALETWAREPLTSSAVDVWSKRTRRLIVNDWYMVDDYHRDHGEGADLYSSGSTRGCGGNGIWTGGKLYPSTNFRNSRVLANGPIRVMFELMYDAWDAHGTRVSESKRITLDAGQNLDRFESFYKVEPAASNLTVAAGIKKSPGSQKTFDAKLGILRTWETLKDAGQLGCGVIVDSNGATESDDSRNFFVLNKTAPDHTARYYAGFGWTKSGDFPTVEAWDRYLAQFAQRIQAPVKVSIAKAQ
jgi:hypothetical protein